MGVDFLDKTKETYVKGWERGYEKLAEKDLFTLSPESIRTILIQPINGQAFSKGHLYELQVNQGGIVAYRDGEPIGICEHPSQFVLDRLNELGGVTLGIFNRTRERSGLVDIAVVLEECTAITEK